MKIPQILTLILKIPQILTLIHESVSFCDLFVS